MARGKIQIQRIENATNRQVTYSKRRNGLFKKARELTVLCDAKVSLIMFPTSKKLHEYTSPSITTKEIIDLYQETTGVDLWSSQYKRMQEELKELEQVNKRLATEIRQRMGYCLDKLSFEELQTLELNLTEYAQIIRDRKYKVVENQIGTLKKKIRSATQMRGALLHGLNEKYYTGADIVDIGLALDQKGYETVLHYPDNEVRSSFPHSGEGSETTYALMSSTSDRMGTILNLN